MGEYMQDQAPTTAEQTSTLRPLQTLVWKSPNAWCPHCRCLHGARDNETCQPGTAALALVFLTGRERLSSLRTALCYRRDSGVGFLSVRNVRMPSPNAACWQKTPGPDAAALVRRKRAMRRAPPGRHHEADWENTTGSDNTDTEGS